MTIMERFAIPIKQFFSDRFPKENIKPHVVITKLKNPRKLLLLAGGLLSILGLVILGLFLKETKYRLLPNTNIEGVVVGGLTAKEAVLMLESNQPALIEHQIELVADEEKIASSSAELGAHFELATTVNQVMTEQQNNLLSWLQQLLFNNQQDQIYPLRIFYDQQRLAFMIQTFKQTFDQPAHYPQADLGISGVPSSLTIDLGQDVFAINVEESQLKLASVLNQTTLSQLADQDSPTISTTAELTTISKQLTDEELTMARNRALGLVGERLVYEKEYTTKILTDQDLIELLTFPEGYATEKLEAILNDWAEELDRPAANAEFKYDPQTLVAESFVPDRKGWVLDTNTLKQKILADSWQLENTDTDNLKNKELRSELSLTESEPAIALADTNDLGIVERIGFGESYYYHSIPNRIHNVSQTAKVVNLTIVPPGEEFSFNETLGEVSSATGFKQAYVIKDGQTLLGDGGGVCQVSTTLFRSLLDAGLQVTRRVQHSYRVSYYELDQQPGFDATVYAGNVDLRFINDTDHHVLIYMETNPSTLYMTTELYGTSDGRTTEISGYKTWDYRDPLPPEYAPDPSLAPGQIKQVDWAASGIKASFTHTIKDKDGEVLSEKTYYSNYRPWAAKYLQGV